MVAENEEVRMMAAELEAAGPRLWAGIDAGKGHHWVCVVDGAGETVWSGKVINDETVILDTLGAVVALGGEITWGIDITGTASGLLLTLLAAHAQTVRYVPGRTVNRMSGAYRGEAKTDARDAYVIAETVRHRSDLAPVEVPAEIVAELRLLVALRADLVADRVRLINRLRACQVVCVSGRDSGFRGRAGSGRGRRARVARGLASSSW